MEASRACQAGKHDKGRESLVPRSLFGMKGTGKGRRLRDKWTGLERDPSEWVVQCERRAGHVRAGLGHYLWREIPLDEYLYYSQH
ncbi:hypothetical protein Tco_1317988 [Tanacetum coccineum]